MTNGAPDQAAAKDNWARLGFWLLPFPGSVGPAGVPARLPRPLGRRVCPLSGAPRTAAEMAGAAGHAIPRREARPRRREGPLGHQPSAPSGAGRPAPAVPVAAALARPPSQSASVARLCGLSHPHSRLQRAPAPGKDFHPSNKQTWVHPNLI